MANICFQMIPSVMTIKILGNTKEFCKWMNKRNPEIKQDELFEGYRFSLNCCLNSFVSEISSDSELEIENDFLLNRAISQNIPIHNLPNTCEKTIFLKNLKPFVKEIVRSKNYDEIELKVNSFKNNIIKKFESIIENNITISKNFGIDKTTALHLLMIDYAHTFLVQINNNGPTANSLNPLSVDWTKNAQKNKYLEGYKYAIQFLWYNILGKEKFDNSNLSNMHLADSWKDYKMIKKDKTGNFMIDLLNEEFSLEDQTNFDSFFYWIKKEITDPLSDYYKFPIYSIDSYFIFSKKNYNKTKLFEPLLVENNEIKKTAPNWEEKIEQCLYWYPFELVDADKSGSYFGISSFNTMLAGAIALHKKKESEFKNIIIVKFIHPDDKNRAKNDYSYGILVDTKSAAGHYSSGWIIFANICGDYSGFSGSEYKSTEKLIEKYLKEKKVQKRELEIPLREFYKFINQKTLDNNQLRVIRQKEQTPLILQKSRAYLFELFVFYLCNKYYAVNYKVDINIDRTALDGEKDVVIQNDQEVILIECKLNPQSNCMEEMVRKIEKKLETFKQPIKNCQFWFWYELSTQNKTFLDKRKILGNPIKIITISKPGGEKILKGIYLKQMREIMQDDNIDLESEFE